jgi:hypothetical protein
MKVSTIIFFLLYLSIFILGLSFGYLWAAIFAASISIVMHLTKRFMSKSKVYSVEDLVQKDLGLWFVGIRRLKPNAKNSLGGFVIPMIPVWVTINPGTNKGAVEPIIHEHMHIYHLIYNFQLALMYLLIFTVETFISNRLLQHFAVIFAVICFLLFQEYITFESTYKYTQKRIPMVVTERFTTFTLKKYLVFYTLFVSYTTAIIIGCAYLRLSSYIALAIILVTYFTVFGKVLRKIFQWLKLVKGDIK